MQARRVWQLGFFARALRSNAKRRSMERNVTGKRSNGDDLRSQDHAVDEVSFRDLMLEVRRLWLLGLAAVIVGAVCFGIAAKLMTPIYRSEVALAPADTDQAEGLAGLASRYGGIAQLAGISIGGRSTIDKPTLALATLSSRQFVTDFIERHQLAPALFAAKRWSRSEQRILYDPEAFDEEKGVLLAGCGCLTGGTVSSQKAYSKFVNEVISVRKQPDSGLTIVAVEHLSPLHAARWATLLVDDLNEQMRRKDQEDAQRAIKFLEDRVQETSLSDMRVVLFELIKEQTKVLTMTEVRPEYVFETIDPSFVPENPSSPNFRLLVGVGFAAGLLIFLAAIFLRLAIQDRRQ